MRAIILVIILCVVSASVDSARILAVVPFPAKSHQRVIQPLLKELALRGHHVTYLSPVTPDDIPPNYKYIPMADYMPNMRKNIEPIQVDANSNKGFFKKYAPIAMILLFKGFGLTFTEWVYDQKEVQDLINSQEKFDAVILETTFFQESLIGIGHRFNATVIEFMPAGNHLWSYWLHGTPFDTSYIGEAVLPFTHHMTFLERVINTGLNSVIRTLWYCYYMPKYQELMDKKLRYDGWESRPPMMDMVSQTSLVLVNSHYSLNYPYATAPHFKEVGGLNIGEVKPLPKDLKSFMDEAKDGVIYFTLGSHIDVSGVLRGNLKDVFSKVFGELKQKVLWKWETDFPDPPPNVKISKWFPQQDILAHENLKLFITHGGFLSTTEAVYQGVPTVGIPIFADQFRNVEHMNFYKYGIPLNLENITYDTLKWTINEALNNPLYAKNAKKQSNIFRDKSETALDTAVYWTEYVIRHKGAEHLRPAIATMPWYQQAMIDVYLTITAIVLIPLYIVYKLTSCFCRCLFGRSKKGDAQKKNKKE